MLVLWSKRQLSHCRMTAGLRMHTVELEGLKLSASGSRSECNKQAKATNHKVKISLELDVNASLAVYSKGGSQIYC